MKNKLLGLLFLFLFGTRVEAEDVKLYSLEDLVDNKNLSFVGVAEKEGVKIYHHDEKSKHRGLYGFLDNNFKDKKKVIVYGCCSNMGAIKGVVDNMPDNIEEEMRKAYLIFLYAAKNLKDSDTGFVFVDLKDFSRIKTGRWRDFLFLIEISKKANGIKLNFPAYLEFKNEEKGYSFERIIDYKSDLVKEE